MPNLNQRVGRRAPSADGRHKVDLAFLAHLLEQAHDGHITVDGDCQIGPYLSVFNEPVLDSGVQLFQPLNHLPDVPGIKVDPLGSAR